METVSIQIPAALFAEIYERYKEETGDTIEKCLNKLLVDIEDDSTSPGTGTQHFIRPGQGTITGRVWEIADQLLDETGEMDRAAVVKACMKEDINMNTASTQYSHWKNAVTES